MTPDLTMMTLYLLAARASPASGAPWPHLRVPVRNQPGKLIFFCKAKSPVKLLNTCSDTKKSAWTYLYENLTREWRISLLRTI